MERDDGGEAYQSLYLHSLPVTWRYIPAVPSVVFGKPCSISPCSTRTLCQAVVDDPAAHVRAHRPHADSGFLHFGQGPSPPLPPGREAANLPGDNPLIRSVPLVYTIGMTTNAPSFIPVNPSFYMMILSPRGRFSPGWLHLSAKFLPSLACVQER